MVWQILQTFGSFIVVCYVRELEATNRLYIVIKLYVVNYNRPATKMQCLFIALALFEQEVSAII